MSWLQTLEFDFQEFLNLGYDIGSVRITVGSVLAGLTVVLLTLWLSRLLEHAAERALRLTKVSDPGTIAVHKDDPGLALGYLNDPDAWAAKFDGDWFLTGDQGVMDEDGNVEPFELF